MKKPFAKLFETERGQVLVMRRDSDDNGPEIAVFFTPNTDCTGLCKVAVSGFGDDEAAEARADAAFEKITEEGVVAITFKQMDQIEAMFRGSHD